MWHKYSFTSFWTRKSFILLMILGGCFFLAYQFLGVIQLGKLLSELSAEKQRSLAEKSKFKSSKIIPSIPGVLPEHLKFYQPTSQGMFKCIKSGKEIAFINLNDDYCDCDDFSDEPSTAACSGGRFFCTKTPAGSKSYLSIASSKVNDGICDCCDGSDEWSSFSPPTHAQIPRHVQIQLHIFQTPCQYHC